MSTTKTTRAGKKTAVTKPTSAAAENTLEKDVAADKSKAGPSKSVPASAKKKAEVINPFFTRRVWPD